MIRHVTESFCCAAFAKGAACSCCAEWVPANDVTEMQTLLTPAGEAFPYRLCAACKGVIVRQVDESGIIDRLILQRILMLACTGGSA